jgi:F-type H+-transporting ATPase subunit epsilon
MTNLKLRIITPQKIVLEEEVLSISLPTPNGEITILPHHINLFSLLTEGIIKFKKQNTEDYLAIGGGYLETDGSTVNILVSRAYGQDAIDEKLTAEAIKKARNILKESKNEAERQQAVAIIRRSLIDSRLIKKRKAKNL